MILPSIRPIILISIRGCRRDPSTIPGLPPFTRPLPRSAMTSFTSWPTVVAAMPLRAPWPSITVMLPRKTAGFRRCRNEPHEHDRLRPRPGTCRRTLLGVGVEERQWQIARDAGARAGGVRGVGAAASRDALAASRARGGECDARLDPSSRGLNAPGQPPGIGYADRSCA